MSDTEVYFSSIEGECIAPLEKIRHLFVWESFSPRRTYCVSISDEDRVRLIRIRQRKRKRSIKTFCKIWEAWSATISTREVAHFEYPVWGIVRMSKDRLKNMVGLILSLLPLWCLTMFICLGKGISMALLISSIWLFPIVLCLVIWYISPTAFHKIWRIPEGIKINFVNGHTRDFLFTDIRYYRLDTTDAYIKFDDGTKLLHLEFTSYWPILREYLLSKLEPTHKNENK